MIYTDKTNRGRKHVECDEGTTTCHGERKGNVECCKDKINTVSVVGIWDNENNYKDDGGPGTKNKEMDL